MIIINGIIITPEKEIRGKALHIRDSRIDGIVRKDSLELSDRLVVDAQGGYILPGFIDIHTHGGAGSDVMDSTHEDLKIISKFHASHGVTSIYATTTTAPIEELIKCVNAVRGITEDKTWGSKILGLHIEGPFLSYENRGAQPAEYLLEPEEEKYKFIIENRDIIKRVTISPGLAGVNKMISDLHNSNIIVSGGHDASIDNEIEEAIKCGMTHTTHAFCAMSTISRKNGTKHLGLNEMVLLDDRLTTEIIADNKHVPALFCKLLFKCKGPEKMCIVSDSLRASGIPEDDTVYMLGQRKEPGGREFIVEGGVAMLPDRSKYAGSVTTMDTMVKNLIRDCSISLLDVVQMASLTPACIMQIDKKKGSLEKGKDADICIMDKDLNVMKTVVEGKIVFSRP